MSDDMSIQFVKLESRVSNIETNFSEIKDLQKETKDLISVMHKDLLEKQAENNNVQTQLKAQHEALDARVRKVERDVDVIEKDVTQARISLGKLAVIGGGSGGLVAGVLKLIEVLSK